jgi:hypothetical protein
MERCVVCGEAITEANLALIVPQTLEDDLFFCNGAECAKAGETFTRIDGIQQRSEYILGERRKNG